MMVMGFEHKGIVFRSMGSWSPCCLAEATSLCCFCWVFVDFPGIYMPNFIAVFSSGSQPV